VQNLVLTVCLNTVYLTHGADAHVTVLTCVLSALRDCVCLLCHMQASERDLRLTYFPQFKACVDAGTYNLMCSYYRCFASILAFSALLCLALF